MEELEGQAGQDSRNVQSKCHRCSTVALAFKFYMLLTFIPVLDSDADSILVLLLL